jgi:YHS domain-containing protein
MLLHAPIGIFIGLAAVEAAMFLARGNGWLGAVRVLAFLGASSAIAAGVSGYVLSLEGSGNNYDTTTIDRHFYFGIAFTVLACLTAALSVWGDRPGPRRAALALTMLTMIPTGHLGATMTHGADFLFGPLADRSHREPNAEFEQPALVATTRFTAEIEPILARTCYACHGEEKTKGGLAMHTREAILAGGDLGSLFVPGKPDASQMIDRMRLPLADDDHMPPEGKPQPTEAEIAAIEAWIKRGASFDEPVEGAGGSKPSIAPAVVPVPAPVTIALPNAAAVTALRTSLAHAEPVARDNPRLIVSFAAIAPTIDDATAERLLEPLADSIEDLTLARTAIGPRTLTLIARMPHLRRLDLGSTPVTSDILVMLKGHPSLKSLVLARTKLAGSDEVVYALATALPKLEELYVWDAGLTPETIERLRAMKPGFTINAGDFATTEKIDAETTVTLTNDAAAPAAAQTQADLKPVNTVCPIAGTPIKPEYQILYKGKVIGFCCPNCPKTFWEDPEKYLATLK